MNLTTNLTVTLTNNEVFTLGPVSQGFQVPTRIVLNWGAGTGSGNVDRHFEATGVTLAAGASVVYTLSALTDSVPRTFGFARVNALVVQVTARTAGDNLVVGDPAGTGTHVWSAPFPAATGAVKVADSLGLGAGLTEGYPVVAGVTDQLAIKNTGANPVTFNLALAGTSV